MKFDTKPLVVAHYNEVALKLGHRAMFVGRLVESIRSALAEFPVGPVRSVSGRVVVELDDADADEVLRRLSVVPGIANLHFAQACPLSIEAIQAVVSENLEQFGLDTAKSFRVDARRANKSFPLKSPEIARQIGGWVKQRTGLTVDLGSADVTIGIVVLDHFSFVTLRRLSGAGGLPVSTGGRVLLLLSGGIDSPVAGVRMMRRGCRIDAIHFHSAPLVAKTSLVKARELAAMMARGQGRLRLFAVAFGEIQREIIATTPEYLRVILYRRLMLRIACAIARKDGKTEALVTGESLGQVASQTLTNMSRISEVANRPILRPLVGMDKQEITDYARKIDTFEISIVPDEDCCSLFVPKHPATGASASELRRAEQDLDMAALVQLGIESVETSWIEPRWDADGKSVADELRG